MPGPTTPPAPLRIRPQRVRQFAYVAAVATVVVFLFSGLTLSGTTAYGGQLFPHDSWALVGVGFAFGGIALTPLRIRADADATHIRIQNIIGDYTVPWSTVRAVRYQRGTPWATLELVTDEVIAVMAVQITDRQRAVAAIRGLRSLHEAAHAGAAPPS